MRPEFSGRLVYGSDFPLINTALVSPWYCCLWLKPKQIYHLSPTQNAWDADVVLEHELGTTAGIFARAGGNW